MILPSDGKSFSGIKGTDGRRFRNVCEGDEGSARVFWVGFCQSTICLENVARNSKVIESRDFVHVGSGFVPHA